jgi:hypothetical protein
MARIVACTPEIAVLFHGPFLELVDANGVFCTTSEMRRNRIQGAMGHTSRPNPQAPVFEMPVAGEGPLGYSCYCALGLTGAGVFGTISGGTIMEWTTPQHEVVELNCEVSSYANAEL